MSNAIPTEPPERLSDEAAELWSEIVARKAMAPTVDAPMLEAYCALVIRWRDAARKIADEGIVVDGDKRGAIVHPALAAERQLAEQIREWAPLFNRPAAAKRKAGPMYDATKRSIEAAKLPDEPQFEGATAAVLTLAWLIDEAQRAGLEAIQKASFVMIPSYLKGCAELQITPASLPAEARKKAGQGGKVDKFQRSAGSRRNLSAVV